MVYSCGGGVEEVKMEEEMKSAVGEEEGEVQKFQMEVWEEKGKEEKLEKKRKTRRR